MEKKKILKRRNANGGGLQRKSGKSTDNHWDFLEEIEAPMWVDFTLEAQFMDNEVDDAWFQTVHPFHQCSSYHLITSFPLLSERQMKSPDLHHPSPKLPDSVSKSRGKHYRSRKWEEVQNVASKSKQHPIRILGGKASSYTVCGKLTSTITSNSSGTSNSSSTKAIASLRNPKSPLNEKVSSISECNLTSTITSKSPCITTKVSFEDSKSTSNSNLTTIAESHHKPSIASLGDSKNASNGNNETVAENHQQPSITCFGNSKSTSNSTIESHQQPLISESSNHMVRYTSRLFSSMKINLTESALTRHASRVEVKDGGLVTHRKSSTSKSSIGSSVIPECNHESIEAAANEEARHRKSSTSKSSVGSSVIPGCNHESIEAAANEEGTPECKKDTSAANPANGRGKAFSVCNASKFKFPDGGSNSNLKWGRKISAAEPIHRREKSKVFHVAGSRKHFWSRNVVDPLKERVASNSKQTTASSKLSRVVGSGKENAAALTGQDQKALKHEIHVKGITGLSNVKQRIAKGTARGKSPTKGIQRAYFR